MTISAERREEILNTLGEANNTVIELPDDSTIEADELRTLLHDSARLERIDDKIELVLDALLADDDHYDPVAHEILRELQAIVNTGGEPEQR